MGAFVERSRARVQAVEGRADERRRQTHVYRMLGARSVSSSLPKPNGNCVVHAHTRHCPVHNPLPQPTWTNTNGNTNGRCQMRTGLETQGTKRFSARVISARLGAHRSSPSCGPSGAQEIEYSHKLIPNS